VSSRATKIWVALSGIAGVAMLTAHFLVPANVPGDNSAPGTLAQFVHHHAAILLTAWLQGFGPLPYVLFALGVVYLAGGMTRFAGWVTLLASAVILTLSLIDAAFTIAAAQAVTGSHAATASVSFDLIDGPGNDAIGRVFLIALPLLLPWELSCSARACCRGSSGTQRLPSAPLASSWASPPCSVPPRSAWRSS
jgi:hypothetical protein